MKKKYLPFIFFLFGISFLINAQTDVEYIISEEDYSEMRVMTQTDGVTFVGGSVHFLGQAKAAIYAFNDKGEKLWEIIFDDLSIVKDMYFRESDQTLIVSVLWAYAIDVGTDMDGPRIYGIDSNGNIQFETIFTRAEFENSFGINHIASTSDDGIVLTSGNWVFWMDSIGTLIDTLSTIQSGYKDFISLNDSTFMALNFSGEIFFLNHEGVISSIIGNDFFERALLNLRTSHR